MSSIKVTNNTNLPIHICMTWKGIVQYYKNDLQPGESHNFDKFFTGWSDFSAVIGTEENKFNHDKDFSNILSFGTAITGAILSITGLVLAPVTGGGSVVLAMSGAAIAAASTSVSIASVVIDGMNGVLMPASVKALFVSDKYTISLTGANILGDHVKSGDEEKFLVSKVEPLQIKWNNLTSGASGIEIAPSE